MTIKPNKRPSTFAALYDLEQQRRKEEAEQKKADQPLVSKTEPGDLIDLKVDQIDLKTDQSTSSIPYRIPTPCRADTVSKSDTVSQSDTVSPSDRVSVGFTPVPNKLFDELAPTLTPAEWTVFLRLYRLSYGWNKETCIVGLETLSSSTNLGRTILREILKKLQQRQLIEILETINSKDLKGTKYKINTISYSDTVSKTDTVSKSDTVSKTDTNKNDDDDLLKTDHHHQSAHARATMTIYQSITGNSWSKTDQTTYEKIQHIPTEIIEQGIRITFDRAASHPGSLAYFVKEILAIANPKPASRAQRRRQLQTIIEQVRAAHTGQPNYSIADFSADVKDACAREGIVFDQRLFNDLLDKPTIQKP